MISNRSHGPTCRWTTAWPLVCISLALGLWGCETKTATPPPEPASADKAPAADPPADPPVERPPDGDTRLRTVYVPAYSNVLRGPDMGSRGLLSILLSVHNVDTAAIITLTHVDYYDTAGQRVRRHLSSPRRLRPLETAEFKVPTNDNTGGSGANFLIYWEGPSDAHSLLTETLMLGNVGGGYVAFTSRGIELDRRPDPADLVPAANPHPEDQPPAAEPHPEDPVPAIKPQDATP